MNLYSFFLLCFPTVAFFEVTVLEELDELDDRDELEELDELDELEEVDALDEFDPLSALFLIFPLELGASVCFVVFTVCSSTALLSLSSSVLSSIVLSSSLFATVHAYCIIVCMLLF